MSRKHLRISAALLATALLPTTSSPAIAVNYKPYSIEVLTVAMQVKCRNPDVYSNYSLGDATNWKKVKPYLKNKTYYWGIKFEGGYSVVAVTMGAKSATLKVLNNGERFLRYVSGCPSKMSISYSYVQNFGED